MTPPVAHTTSLESRQTTVRGVIHTGYRAACTCPWRGRFYYGQQFGSEGEVDDARATAEQDARQHLIDEGVITE